MLICVAYLSGMDRDMHTSLSKYSNCCFMILIAWDSVHTYNISIINDICIYKYNIRSVLGVYDIWSHIKYTRNIWYSICDIFC